MSKFHSPRFVTLLVFAACSMLMISPLHGVLTTAGAAEQSPGAGNDGPQSIAGFDITNLDRSAQACQDFNQFANGGWIAKNPIPPAYSRWGTFEQLAERNENTLHQILDDLLAKKALANGPDRKVAD